jgi:hypothetical protein
MTSPFGFSSTNAFAVVVLGTFGFFFFFVGVVDVGFSLEADAPLASSFSFRPNLDLMNVLKPIYSDESLRIVGVDLCWHGRELGRGGT